MLRLGLVVVRRTMGLGLGGRFLLRCTSAPREALVEGSASGMVGMAVGSQVGPAQPQVGALTHALDVVGIGGRLGALAAGRVLRKEHPAASPPVGIVAALGRAGPLLVEERLPPRLSLLAGRHARGAMTRRHRGHRRHPLTKTPAQECWAGDGHANSSIMAHIGGPSDAACQDVVGDSGTKCGPQSILGPRIQPLISHQRSSPAT